MASIRTVRVRALAWLMPMVLFSAAAVAQSANPFVPKEFAVPPTLETGEFRLRMLTVNDVVKDFDAVMTSVEHLQTIWPDSSWPEGLTFEQDLTDLGSHQKEWPFKKVAYPGRDIDWKTWQAIPDEKR